MNKHMLPRDKSEINCESQPDTVIKSSNNAQVGALIGPFIVRSLIGRRVLPVLLNLDKLTF